VPAERTDSDVIVDFVFERGLLFVELRNLGDAPALKVRCTFDKPFRGLGGARAMNELRLFRALEFLAPGRAVRTLLDTSSAYFARKEPTRLTATIAYRTSAGEKRGGAVTHDLSVYRDLAYVPEGADDA
jgi:hypothetical protein